MMGSIKLSTAVYLAHILREGTISTTDAVDKVMKTHRIPQRCRGLILQGVQELKRIDDLEKEWGNGNEENQDCFN